MRATLTAKIARLATCLVTLAVLAHADTLKVGLAEDPGQLYSFAPMNETAGTIDTETVGPYYGWAGWNTDIPDYGYFLSLNFQLSADPGKSYPGREIAPATPGQLEAAYLAAQLAAFGFQNATLAQRGAISMAIWQVMDPAPGDVPLDPAAQLYVASAVGAFQGGLLTAAEFSDTVLFVPSDPHVPQFLFPGATDLQLNLSEGQPENVPEPGTLVLLAAGGGLIGLGGLRRRRRK